MHDTISVLMIDDDEDDFMLTRELLADVKHVHYHLDWVQRFEDALEAIDRDEHDVYLIDYRLEGHDGLQLLQEACRNGCAKPFILLTGLGNPELDLAAMNSGASDFIDKNHLTSELLERSLRYALQTHKVQNEKLELERRLQQAQKMEAIGTLAGGIAHDFNNILSSVIGFTELALKDAEEESLLEDNLQEIYSAGKRAKDLVNQILAFSRRSTEQPRPIHVDLVAKEVLKLIRATLPADIQIRQNIDSTAMVKGDVTELHQVFMNLLTNAAHAMEKTGGTLAVSLMDVRVEADDRREIGNLAAGEYLKIEVADTGRGIPADIVDAIFEPYFTTKEPEEGTGMGLAVVQGIVKRCQGDIKVDSSPGRGTTFTIHLPAMPECEPLVECKPAALPTGDERILIVDDELPIVKSTGLLLEGLGYRVTTLTAGEAALNLFKKKPTDFDLVITDMTMPCMAGDRLAEAVLNIRPDIPIVLCTGYSKKISPQKAKDIGIRRMLIKPVLKDQLATTIREVLDGG